MRLKVRPTYSLIVSLRSDLHGLGGSDNALDVRSD